eukprot:11350846-Alexandrium_andersonii.AAC.1
MPASALPTGKAKVAELSSNRAAAARACRARLRPRRITLLSACTGPWSRGCGGEPPDSRSGW